MTSNLEKARLAADDATEVFIRTKSLLMNARVKRTQELFEELAQALEEAQLCAEDASGMLEGLISEGRAFLQDASPDATLAAERIARKLLRIETLERRYSDSLDFHDLAVWSLRSALEAAYTAGLKDGLSSH